MKSKKFYEFLRIYLSRVIAITIYFTLLYSLAESVSVHYINSALIAGVISAVISYNLRKFWNLDTYNGFELCSLKEARAQRRWYVFSRTWLICISAVVMYYLVKVTNLHYLKASALLMLGFYAAKFVATHNIFPSSNTIKAKRFKNYIVIAIKGEFVGNEIEEFSSIVAEYLENRYHHGKPSIIVDLGGTSKINSCGIGALLRAQTKMFSIKGYVALVNISPEIANTFVITKLNQVFTITSMEEAIKHVR